MAERSVKAARSVKIEVQNDTGRTLNKVSESLAHGTWRDTPPNSIGGAGSWESESDGVATGTEGTASYNIDGGGTVVFYWNNPYIGSNDYRIDCSSGYTGRREGGSGDNATVKFSWDERSRA